MGKRIKVVQEHINFINEIIEKIIQGQINSLEAEEYVNNRAQQYGIARISSYTIINLVEELLESKPDKLTLYRKNRKHNKGKRNPKKTKDEVRKKIIEEELPKIMNAEIESTNVAERYGISAKTVRRIIEDYLKDKEDEYKKYKKMITNKGASLEIRKKATQKKSEFGRVNIATNEEFIELPLEEQREMVCLKFLKTNLKDNKGLSDKEWVDKKVRELESYFLERNKDEKNKGQFTKSEILHMMYRFPTIINYSIEEKINKMIVYLEEDANLGYKCTNQIIKRFPQILGYGIERTKKQMKILQDNNLTDAIMDNPMRLMDSPELMHALIEFAKERHKTTNLDNINRNNIFLASRTIKRLYHTDYNEIKSRFPLVRKELSIEEI